MSEAYHRVTPNEYSRFGRLEGHEELFDSKILRVEMAEGTAANQESILIIARDPGSANALAPVVDILRTERPMAMFAITDGRAQEILQRRFSTTDVTPASSFLAADTVVGQPKVLLVNSSPSEIGLETYAAATYHDSPMVMVEDYYTSGTTFLEAVGQRDLQPPEAICVIDHAARQLIIDRFPELADRIEVTGQPAFDRFAREDTEAISRATRERLGITAEEKLVCFMSSFVEMDRVPEAAINGLIEQLRHVPTSFALAFRQHPRDNVPYATYEQLFAAAGIRTVDTRQCTSDEVSAAADLVMTTWSTEGLHAIYRRKPTIHLVDQTIMELPAGLPLPLPPVRLGASVGVDNVQSLGAAVEHLLSPDNDAAEQLRRQMERFYPADGKNAQRVADVVQRILDRGEDAGHTA